MKKILNSCYPPSINKQHEELKTPYITPNQSEDTQLHIPYTHGYSKKKFKDVKTFLKISFNLIREKSVNKIKRKVSLKKKLSAPNSSKNHCWCM